MARASKAVHAAWDRWLRARRFKALKDRIDSAIGRTLCERHFEKLQEGIYVDGLHEVCTMVFEAEESVDREVEAFFPLAPKRISQEKLKEFKKWFNSEIGKPIRVEGFQWYRYIRYAILICPVCRGHDPFLINSDFDSKIASEIDTDE